MIETGAVQENNQRKFGGERFTAGRCEDLGTVHSQNHVSSFLRKAKRLAEIADDILGGFDADGEPDQFFAMPATFNCSAFIC